jgi:nitrous oxidase accessory protein NosD
MRTVALFALLTTAVACSLFAAPAYAQRDRVFVASYGSDSNPCTFGSPCKTFQQAINVVAQGGEVTAIDSAGFGTITLSHSVTITSPNGIEAGIAAPGPGGNAISITAGPNDNIVLNGLTLDGADVPATNGIIFYSGGTLTIRNSVIRNFKNSGIDYGPNTTSHLFMSDTLVSQNAQYGIYITNSSAGTVDAVLDNVTIENNAPYGLFLQGGSTAMLRNCTVADNGLGLYSNNSSTIWVTRSTITGNSTGWSNSNAAVLSYGDNNIDNNAAGDTAPPAIGYK